MSLLRTSIHFTEGETNDAKPLIHHDSKVSVQLGDASVIFQTREQAIDIISDLLIGVRNA